MMVRFLLGLRRRARRRLDRAFTRFPAGKAVKALVLAAVVLVIVAVTTLPAFAGPNGAGLGAFAVFDITDSRGINVSQYELSLDTGGLTAPLKMWLSARLLSGWNLYRYSVSLFAYLVDWTINMSWLALITDPLDRIAQQLRTQVLNPAGLVGFMLVVSAAVGATRLLFGRMGKGLWDIVSACIVAALVAGILANPVSAFTADPLTKTRQVGVGVANMIVSGGVLPDTNPDQAPPDSKLEIGKTLIDTMVRPAHGLINYGVNFTDDQPCTGAYDKALKAGPYWDPDATKTRQAVGGCNGKLGDFAKYSIYTASASMGVFLLTGTLICLLLGLICALLFIAVMMLVWNLLKLVITAVIGIGPGDTRGPMIHNLAQAIVSLVYVASSMVALAVVLALIQKAFTAQDTNPMLRFIIADLVVIGGFVMVIQTWTAHRRGGESWARKLMTRMKQTAPKPTIASKVGGWLKGPVGGQASVYGDLAGGPAAASGGGGSLARAGGGMAVGRMLRPVTNSNAFNLARMATVGAATGGIGGVVMTAKGAAVTARGATRTVRAANNVRRTYAATQHGARHATTGTPVLDTAVDQTARAHQWLQAKAVQAHQRGFDTVGRTGQKLRAEAPGAVASAVTGLLGPNIGKPSPAPQHTRSQPHTKPDQPMPHRGPGGTGHTPHRDTTRTGTAPAASVVPPPQRGRPAAPPARPEPAGPRPGLTTPPGKPPVPVVVEQASTAAARVMNLVHEPRPARPSQPLTRPGIGPAKPGTR